MLQNNQQSEPKAQESSQQDDFTVSAPGISLPKGGGGIRGLGEKFTANPVTGTGSMSIPIFTSPGRSGFGPELALSYNSGAGNGSFGLGWNLSLPSITRKTDKGLPKYQDHIESDTFILSGAEDLVPYIELNANPSVTQRTIHRTSYKVKFYRPRIEGLFARIEKWTNTNDPGDSFWRSISKDNIITWYGKTEASRIADPANKSHIFSWLICESYDDKGNLIVYGYKPEDADSITLSQIHEANREDRSANRTIKYVRYSYRTPYLPKLSETEPWPEPPQATRDEKPWLFETVFDYGDHDQTNPLPEESQPGEGVSSRIGRRGPGEGVSSRIVASIFVRCVQLLPDEC